MVRMAAALGVGFPAAVLVTVALAAISLLTATLKKNHNDDDDESCRKYYGFRDRSGAWKISIHGWINEVIIVFVRR